MNDNLEKQIVLNNSFNVNKHIIDLSFPPKESFKEILKDVYKVYEYLYSCFISEEIFSKIPDLLKRHLTYYYGHASYENAKKMKLLGLIKTKITFYDDFFEISPNSLNSSSEFRSLLFPKLDEISNYRNDVLEIIYTLIDEQELNFPIKKDSFYWVLNSCIEYNRIFFEKSILAIRMVDLEYLKKPDLFQCADYSTKNYPKNEFLEISKSKIITLGKPEDFPTFGWDNEYGEILINSKPFKATKFLITNGEYLEFVKDKCYNDKKYWSDEGWAWIERGVTDSWKKSRIEEPLFWIKKQDKKNEYALRCVFDEIDLPLNWPVEVNYYEAKAYCNWLQEKNGLKNSFYRLIKEEELSILRGDEEFRNNLNLKGIKKDFTLFDEEIGNTHLKYFSASPVDKFKPSPLGFYDTVGNLWELTDSHLNQFPGFKPETYYNDFSIPFFNSNHILILGCSWSSSGEQVSSFFRSASSKEAHQNCGFRIVEEKFPELDLQSFYENKKVINSFILSNYFDCSPEKNLFGSLEIDSEIKYTDYSTKYAQYAIDYYLKTNCLESLEDKTISAFELGCGIGKLTFELARNCKKVIGGEYSAGLIEVCNKLQSTGKYTYEYLIQHDIYNKADAVIDPKIELSRVSFIQVDACYLPSEIGPFDIIISVNLIDRISNPKKCLFELYNKLNKNGILIITTPYFWEEKYASKEFWIGGKDKVSPQDALINFMKSINFELIDQKLVHMLFRENKLLYELLLSHMTVWKRKY